MECESVITGDVLVKVDHKLPFYLGTNIEDGMAFVPPFMGKISEAVKEGLLSESLVREYVKPLFEVRMRLGEFDPPAMNPYTKFGVDLVQNAEHRNLSEELALKSFVLLKNSNSYLPLDASKKFKKLAVRYTKVNEDICFFL